MVWGNSGTLYHQTILKVQQIAHFHPSILFHVSNSGPLECWSPSQLPWDERQSTAWTGRQCAAGQPIWFCSLVQWPLTTPQHYNVTQWGYKVWLLKQSYFWFACVFSSSPRSLIHRFIGLFFVVVSLPSCFCPLQGFTTMKPCLDFCEVLLCSSFTKFWICVHFLSENKTALCVCSCLCLIFRFVWWSDSLKCDKHEKKT